MTAGMICPFIQIRSLKSHNFIVLKVDFLWCMRAAEGQPLNALIDGRFCSLDFTPHPRHICWRAMTKPESCVQEGLFSNVPPQQPPPDRTFSSLKTTSNNISHRFIQLDRLSFKHDH
eukprot:scaffold4011_cov197-Ochromonas_danica.AAC.21